MRAIPLTLQKKFDNYLKRKEIPDKFKGEYKKWLQYYLDFCRKYDFSATNHESLPPFIRKLEEKRQTKAQQERAYNSINLYYQIVRTKATSNNDKALKTEASKEYIPLEGDGSFNDLSRTAAPAPPQYKRLGPALLRVHHDHQKPVEFPLL